ncbi:MAG TPA: Uma2 family endonuclease, partial [Cryptosporangiaceae bacterium]|nr:Uma2 family endonuclease [Cryptosporangiaceae bacterium]
HGHQTIALLLGATLHRLCPDEYDVTQAVEIRINRFRSLIPDLLVVTAEAAARNPSKYHPHEVVLVVEIVSPSSKAMDRATKPAMYAEAGIPHYWRIETEPHIAGHTCRLDPIRQVYEAVASHADVLSVTDPWPIELPLSAITPRLP